MCHRSGDARNFVSRPPRMAGTWGVVSKAFVWIACTAGFLYQASDVLQLYTRHAFTVTVYKEHGSRHIRFPAATICTEKWSKRDVLCGNNNSLCQGGPEALAERLLFDPELRNEAAYTPSELFNCRMRSLDDKCTAFSCTPMIRRTFYRTPFLMCYTFDLYQYSEPSHPFRSCEVPWLYEVELTVAWDALKTGPTDNVLKYPLIVHEPEVCPPEKLAPIHLRQGMRYTVSIAQRVFRRLPYPSASRCTDYRGRGRVGAYFGYMNYAVCLQDCLIQQELRTCGCAFHEHEFAATSFNGVLCSSEKKSKCAKMFSRDLNYKICKERCSQPCSEITYDVKLTGLADNEIVIHGQNSLRDKFANCLRLPETAYGTGGARLHWRLPRPLAWRVPVLDLRGAGNIADRVPSQSLSRVQELSTCLRVHHWFVVCRAR